MAPEDARDDRRAADIDSTSRDLRPEPGTGAAMRRATRRLDLLVLVLMLAVVPALVGSACGGDDGPDPSGDALEVVATTSVLADIAQQVAGDRFRVEPLIPPGTDPHAFEPTPEDLRRLVGADLVIVNGAGLESSLDDYLGDVGEDAVVVASRGLESRTPGPDEPGIGHDDEGHGDAEGAEQDPHYWLDPILAESYVDTIAAAFEDADPEHADDYAANAAAYKERLAELDEFTRETVAAVPEERRKLVMNHASHGYWADRYGFEIVGAVIPSVSSGAAPTARDLADLLETIEREGVPAVFVQVGENPQLAERIAADAGVTVVEDLYTGSLSGPDGPAPTYADLIEDTARRISEALADGPQ